MTCPNREGCFCSSLFKACLFVISDIKLRSDKYFLLIATTFFQPPWSINYFQAKKNKKKTPFSGKPYLGYDNSRITITGLLGIGRNIDKFISLNPKWFRDHTKFKYLHNWTLKWKNKTILDMKQNQGYKKMFWH